MGKTKITKFKEPIYITKPVLPELSEVNKCLKEIWESRVLTNNGNFHKRFEGALKKYMGIAYCSLFCNGTLALQVAVNVLRLSGEVITTPFTFPATSHVLYWNAT